ncbi:MAG: ABC transporter permease [Treponema sp.]|nr:ABC transporter permease [Treponema sp.]MBR3549413.1 ABC transporter permease [Treponema sp.]MBR6143904.1 ABC transporter permease [Treponema sp.]
MFWRMVFRALGRQKKKMLMIAFTIALGSSLATAMLNVMFDVGDKVNQELKTYGANIRVVPQSESLLTEEFGFDDNISQFLKEEELGKIKTIFWAFNIVDFAPYFESSAYLKDGEKVSVSGTWFKKHLELPTGETLDTGMTAMKTWWSVQGSWLDDGDDTGAMVGSAFSKRNGISVGDTISLFRKAEGKQRGQTWIVKGIFDSGSDEDEKVYITIKSAQKLFEKPGLVTSIEVSALTTPDNDLARRAAQDPSSLNRNDWDTWYCTAYVSSICYQIQEVISNSCAKAVRQVAESEGAILNKTQLLMLLITILSLIGSALGISNLVTASVMERAQEIGLLKAIGAHDAPISILVLTEILITAILGGIIGYFAGLGFAQIIGQSVFDSAINIKATVIPLVAILIFVVTMAGSVPSIKLLLSLKPAEVLHGR